MARGPAFGVTKLSFISDQIKSLCDDESLKSLRRVQCYFLVNWFSFFLIVWRNKHKYIAIEFVVIWTRFRFCKYRVKTCYYYFLAHEQKPVDTKYWNQEKVHNWLQQAIRVWTCSETRPRSCFGKPPITVRTGTWSLWSLLQLWSPAFPVPEPAQLPDGARYRLFQ